MNKKNILIITNLFPLKWEPNRSTFNYQQFSRLGKTYNVTVFIPVPFVLYYKKRNIIDDQKSDLINKEYFPFFYMPGLFRFLHAPSLFVSLMLRYQKIKRLNADLVIGSWANPDGFASLLLSKILKLPCIIKVHGNDINVLANEKIRGKVIRWTLSNVKNVVSVSNDLKKKINKLTDNKAVVNVIYNGIDRSIFSKRDVSEVRNDLTIMGADKIIVFVGNFKKSKGVIDLYDAFKNLLTEHKNIRLYLIGSGECKTVLERRIKHDGLSENIFFPGTMPLETVSKYISAADVLCLPSYNEGVPNVLLEAKACGVPVVATRVGGIPEIVSEVDGILVDVNNIEQLSNALLVALNKDWDRGAIVKESLSYSWDKNLTELNMIIEKYI